MADFEIRNRPDLYKLYRPKGKFNAKEWWRYAILAEIWKVRCARREDTWRIAGNKAGNILQQIRVLIEQNGSSVDGLSLDDLSDNYVPEMANRLRKMEIMCEDLGRENLALRKMLKSLLTPLTKDGLETKALELDQEDGYPVSLEEIEDQIRSLEAQQQAERERVEAQARAELEAKAEAAATAGMASRIAGREQELEDLASLATTISSKPLGGYGTGIGEETGGYVLDDESINSGIHVNQFADGSSQTEIGDFQLPNLHSPYEKLLPPIELKQRSSKSGSKRNSRGFNRSGVPDTGSRDRGSGQDRTGQDVQSDDVDNNNNSGTSRIDRTTNGNNNINNNNDDDDNDITNNNNHRRVSPRITNTKSPYNVRMGHYSRNHKNNNSNNNNNKHTSKPDRSSNPYAGAGNYKTRPGVKPLADKYPSYVEQEAMRKEQAAKRREEMILAKADKLMKAAARLDDSQKPTAFLPVVVASNNNNSRDVNNNHVNSSNKVAGGAISASSSTRTNNQQRSALVPPLPLSTEQEQEQKQRKRSPGGAGGDGSGRGEEARGRRLVREEVTSRSRSPRNKGKRGGGGGSRSTSASASRERNKALSAAPIVQPLWNADFNIEKDKKPVQSARAAGSARSRQDRDVARARSATNNDTNPRKAVVAASAKATGLKTKRTSPRIYYPKVTEDMSEAQKMTVGILRTVRHKYQKGHNKEKPLSTIEKTLMKSPLAQPVVNTKYERGFELLSPREQAKLRNMHISPRTNSFNISPRTSVVSSSGAVNGMAPPPPTVAPAAVKTAMTAANSNASVVAIKDKGENRPTGGVSTAAAVAEEEEGKADAEAVNDGDDLEPSTEKKNRSATGSKSPGDDGRSHGLTPREAYAVELPAIIEAITQAAIEEVVSVASASEDIVDDDDTQTAAKHNNNDSTNNNADITSAAAADNDADNDADADTGADTGAGDDDDIKGSEAIKISADDEIGVDNTTASDCNGVFLPEKPQHLSDGSVIREEQEEQEEQEEEEEEQEEPAAEAGVDSNSKHAAAAAADPEQGQQE